MNARKTFDLYFGLVCLALMWVIAGGKGLLYILIPVGALCQWLGLIP